MKQFIIIFLVLAGTTALAHAQVARTDSAAKARWAEFNQDNESRLKVVWDQSFGRFSKMLGTTRSFDVAVYSDCFFHRNIVGNLRGGVSGGHSACMGGCSGSILLNALLLGCIRRRGFWRSVLAHFRYHHIIVTRYRLRPDGSCNHSNAPCHISRHTFNFVLYRVGDVFCMI